MKCIWADESIAASMCAAGLLPGASSVCRENMTEETNTVCFHCHYHAYNDIHRYRPAYMNDFSCMITHLYLTSGVSITAASYSTVEMERAGGENPMETGRLFLDSILVRSLSLPGDCSIKGRQTTGSMNYVQHH